MSSSWTRAFGLSMTVCLIAILAAPALAADSFHGRIVSPVSRGTGLTGLQGRGANLFTSLQVMGFPVVGPLALLSGAKNIIQRFVNPASRGTAGTLVRNLRTGWNQRTFNRSTLPAYPARMGTPGTAGIGFAENLTAYLAGKGYDVSDLNPALSDARTALADSNTTALRVAMRTFQGNLNAKVTAGTINRTVIQDYLKTESSVDSGFRAREIPARGMRMPGRFFVR
ncbi:MAG: hypothetical protein LUQ32_08920 [Methanomicrobiales archaeon]|nr:hypothetical protein [Methanomicrobiales archaeon]